MLRPVIASTVFALTLLLPANGATAALPSTGVQRTGQTQSTRLGRDRRLSPQRKRLIADTLAAMQKAVPALNPKQVKRFDRTIHRVVAAASDEDIQQLTKTPLTQRIKRVKELEKEQRRVRDEAFLATLKSEEAAAIRRLPHGERIRRITDLRLQHELETAITNAMAQGLITEEAAAELRAAERRAQLEGARRLNKETFIHLHRDNLSKGKIDRLEKLSAKVFFDDPDVRRFRLLDGLDSSSMKAIRRLDTAQRRALLDVIRSGADHEALSVLSLKSREWLRGLNGVTRKRLARELEHVRLHKKRRLAIPRHLKSELSSKDRRAFNQLGDSARIKWLESRFPEEDWKRIYRGFNAQRDLDRLVSKLDSAERRAISRLSADRLQAFLKERVDNPESLRALVSAARRRGWGKRLRLPPALIRRLTPDEEKRFDEMGHEEAIFWVVRRFRRELLPIVVRLMNQAELRPIPSRGQLPTPRQLHGLMGVYGGPRGLSRRLGEEFERRRGSQRR